ncbi:ATP/GTP-binding protein [Kitasatospora xanthocidica]|uniref:ATP/GTP-binding protein n=1 Tax=Kitasatospora xanthocidica TaxID=83382 RepID=UPI0036ED98D8
MPCHSPDWGWFSSQDGCYYSLMDPQPPAGSWYWPGGKQPGDGAIYLRTCPLDNGSGATGDTGGAGPVWLQTPPPGFGGGPTPAQLAQQIFLTMTFSPPAISTAPAAGGKGVVGMPVWMWATPSQTSWGPWTKADSSGGLTVSVTAKVSKAVWAMGDGGSRTCTGPGTPYTTTAGNSESPDCGYRYSSSSAGKPNGAYPVTATTTWTVHWEGGGQQGDLPPVTKTSATALTVGEVQVLN